MSLKKNETNYFFLYKNINMYILLYIYILNDFHLYLNNY